MNLSERSMGYKKMAEFINELGITSCDDLDHLKMYKNIKTALTFVSSDMFGYLCNDEQIEIEDNHWTESLIDDGGNIIHLGNVADVLLGANWIMHPSYPQKFGVSTFDRCTDIHRVFTDPLPPLDADDSKHASNDFIRFEGVVIIYETMNSVAKNILEKASHKKVQINVQLSSIYKFGEFSSAEAAKKEYGDCEISIDMLKDKERLSSQIEFTEEKTDDYATRAEIEADWGESSDEVDVDAEFEDNIKLGTFKANIADEKMYEKILELNNYKFIKNDNGGELVCQKIL